MFTHTTTIRVRYSETDKMGYLHHSHYPKYYEVARVEAMRSIGIRYRDLEDEHFIIMPVMSLNMRFVRPAYFDDLLTVKTTLRKLPTTTMTFHVELFNEQKKIVNGGSIKLCFVDKQRDQTINLPPILSERIKPYFE